MIFWKPGNFCESKVLWVYNGLNSIFGRFFRLFEIGSKSCFKMAVNLRETSMVCENYFAAFKCYMGTSFFRVDALPSGRRRVG